MNCVGKDHTDLYRAVAISSFCFRDIVEMSGNIGFFCRIYLHLPNFASHTLENFIFGFNLTINLRHYRR